jgi:uncharacterized protein (DUF1697 family)
MSAPTERGSPGGGGGQRTVSCVALLQGINVGRARRIAMSALRALLEALGLREVRTLLNSGNAVFRGRPDVETTASAIRAAIEARFGFSVPVIVLTAEQLNAIVAENGLPQATDNPSRLLVAFVSTRSALDRARALLAQSWAPEVLAVGSQAAYVWCVNGVARSPLMRVLAQVGTDAVTTRNWATVLRLQAAAGETRQAP